MHPEIKTLVIGNEQEFIKEYDQLRLDLTEARAQAEQLRIIVTDACYTLGIDPTEVDSSGASEFAMLISAGVVSHIQVAERDATIQYFAERVSEVVGEEPITDAGEAIECLIALFQFHSNQWKSGDATIQALGEQLEHDRSLVADCVTLAKAEVNDRHWLTEGRGPYEWNDDRWHEEFRAAAVAILAALEPMVKVAADWSGCPKDGKAVAAARIDLKATIQRLEKVIEAAPHAPECQSLQRVHQPGYPHYETDANESCPDWHFKPLGPCDCWKADFAAGKDQANGK